MSHDTLVRHRYDEINRMHAALEVKTRGMSEEERQRFIAEAVGGGPGSGHPCCTDGICPLHSAAGPAMSQQEQLAFFESLATKPK